MRWALGEDKTTLLLNMYRVPRALARARVHGHSMAIGIALALGPLDGARLGWESMKTHWSPRETSTRIRPRRGDLGSRRVLQGGNCSRVW